MQFTGRATDLDHLTRQLHSVADGAAGTPGRAVVVTGRRRVGKSRLVQEFCDRSGTPYTVFQATRGRSPVAERAEFVEAARRLGSPGAELIHGLSAADWNQALRALAVATPDDRPSIAVLDEVPWLVEQDPEFEGALQTVWDRNLSHKPLLLILIGSDISVMEALGARDRPFFGRATKMTVDPLDVADVQTMTGLDAAAAIDARLITGGFPQILASWRHGMNRLDFLREATADPLSPLLIAGELSMLGEFPEGTRSRAVLRAIGSGERTFSTIAAQAGSKGELPAGTLNPLLKTLQDKRIVAADLPLSTTADTKNKRYRITDSYLRFWLAFLERGIPLVERGRGDLALTRIERSWTSWRGRAVEPLIRAALLRLLPDQNWPDTEEVGGWWNRNNNPEVDLIGTDRAPVAKAIHFIGSIKWLENHPFDRHDYDALARSVLAIPGTAADTPLVAVSRSGVTPDAPVQTWWGPDELVEAWRNS
ncbi:ATP-binding protein [Nocardia sp. NPDC058176]|uniref:ATP-binding protein n=1 Tax=Nocardia sp. NPDC058176 TaxID=3346368 RepID=UPI0036D78236